MLWNILGSMLGWLILGYLIVGAWPMIRRHAGLVRGLLPRRRRGPRTSRRSDRAGVL